MIKPGRNDPCPCGSGKKFKKCHLGREGELFLRKNEILNEKAGGQICRLPEVHYGRSEEMIDHLRQEGFWEGGFDVKCIDLEAYRKLGVSGQEIPAQSLKVSSGILVNPRKTGEADPNHLYLAVTPHLQDSTLIHELAHILDYIKGDGSLPGTYQQMSLETGIPIEHLDHTQEFGKWLTWLADRFQVNLDAEDAIVSYLFQNEMLLKREEIKTKDANALIYRSKQILDFLIANKSHINTMIQDRAGYIGKQ
jgi:hypothetical protein